MNWIIEPEYIACIEILILLVYTFTDRGAASLRTRMFLLCLGISLLGIGMNILSIHTINNAQTIPLWINWLVNSLFFILTPLMGSVIASYMLVLVFAHSLSRRGFRFMLVLLWMVYPVYLVLVATNISNHLLFSFSESFEYTRGPLNQAPYLLLIWYVILCLISFFSQMRTADRALKRVMRIVPFVVLALAFVQFMAPEVMMTGTATAIALIVLFIFCQQGTIGADQLTGLNNRESFYTTVETLTRNGTRFHALFVSLRGYKNINNRFGQRGGDQVLIAVGAYLRELRHNALVFRFGAVEFIVIFRSIEAAEYENALRAVIARFDESWTVMGMTTHLPACFADITYPDHTSDANRLIDSLEYATRLAKYGDDKVVRFNELISRQLTRRNYVLSMLKTAFIENLFFMNYQPIYDCEHERIISAEALVRLQDRDSVVMMPSEFVPLAEESGMIVELSWVVMEKTCRFLSEQNDEISIESISINLPPQQFVEEDMVNKTLALLQKYHVNPNRLKIEITERTIISDIQKVTRVIHELNQIGIGMYLDDFGTGYSNLAYVAQMPFECVKIDRSMLDPIAESENSYKMLEAVVRGLKHTGAKVLIEGVETGEQVALVRRLGIDRIQGYYYNRPLEEDELIARMRRDQKDHKPRSTTRVGAPSVFWDMDE